MTTWIQILTVIATFCAHDPTCFRNKLECIGIEVAEDVKRACDYEKHHKEPGFVCQSNANPRYENYLITCLEKKK